MRLLIIDDDSDLVKALANRIKRISAAIDCMTAGSIAEARETMLRATPDVCLVDLALPSVAGAHDETIDKGQSLVREIAERFPGTFIILYSAYSANHITDPLYEELNARRPNVFGTMEPAMFVNRPKEHPLRAVDDIRQIYERRKALFDDLQFENYQIEATLERPAAQILRAYGKSRGASTIGLRKLTGGKSSAAVFAATYFDADGNPMLHAVMKLDHWARVKNEEQNFEAYVAGMLELGSYAPLLNREAFLSGEAAGMFYQEIAPLLGDLSSRWDADRRQANELVERIRLIERGWTDLARMEQWTVGELRRRLISDKSLEEISDLRFDMARIDAIPFRMRTCLQHGDLHAGNILMTTDAKPYFLDFAKIQRLPASFDALTLELAYVFNNPSRAAGAWPDETSLRQWHQPEIYFRSCPAAHMLSAARSWSISAATGFPPTATYAIVLCYALRQMQFADTDLGLAIALAETMVDLLERP